jgi:hypothetical protein
VWREKTWEIERVRKGPKLYNFVWAMGNDWNVSNRAGKNNTFWILTKALTDNKATKIDIGKQKQELSL